MSITKTVTKKYVIKKIYNYYSGTLYVPQNHYLTDNNNNKLTFDTKEQAQQYISDITPDIYYLQHGEAGSPDYKIILTKNY